MFEIAFKEQINLFSKDEELKEEVWKKIEKEYSRKTRYYHNLLHLENMHNSLLPVKHKIIDWSVIVFSIAFHDLVYKTYRKDNEEKSAEAAGKYLDLLGVPADKNKKCREQILATKLHQRSNEEDTNYFTDADLAILGSDETAYDNYCSNIRKEYRLFPHLVYNPERKKFLIKLLQQESIFKTKHFQDEFEEIARKNIAGEIERL